MAVQSPPSSFRFVLRERALLFCCSLLLGLGAVAVAASTAAQAATVSGVGVYNEGTITATFDVEGDALSASGTAEFSFDASGMGGHTELYRGEATCVEATVTRRGYQATIGGELTLYENELGLGPPYPSYFHVTIADNVRGDKIDKTSSWSLDDNPGCTREEPLFALESGGFAITGALGPETVITKGPGGPTKDSTPTIVFTSSEAGSTFQCRFDAEEFAPCSGPGAKHTPAVPLADGPHSFEVTATDAAGYADQTPATSSFSVDTLAPNTIGSGPTGSIGYTQPTFTFSSDDPTAQFECILDSIAYGCGSPFQTGSLAEGKHTLKLRARDEAGNIDKTPLSFSFTIDLTAPETTVVSPPVATKDSTPRFRFTSSEAGSTFQCRFDSEAFAPCSGPGAYHTAATPLSDGVHEFQVRATDKAGNVDPGAASATFTVDTVKPETTIDSGPSGSSPPSPTFEFSADDPTVFRFECRLDTASFAPCESPLEYSSLAGGPHTFRVRAIDAAGNVDSTPALRKFTVDQPEEG